MMQRTPWIIVIAICVAVASCADTEIGGGEAGDEISVVEETDPVPGLVVSEQEIAERQERIRAFFDDRLLRFDIVATTMTEAGQIIDWIRPESQTVDGFIAEPPAAELALDPGMPDREAGPNQAEPPPVVGEPAFTDLQLQPDALGPEGTVPVVRFDVEAYLASVEIPPQDPLEMISKVPPAPAPAPNSRYYAVSTQNGTFLGTAACINVYDTAGPTNGSDTSIMQTAVIRGNPMQAIEAGKLESRSVDTPSFFVYFRTAFDAAGDWKGGYNQNVDGWVQYSRKATNSSSVSKCVYTRGTGGSAPSASGPDTTRIAREEMPDHATRGHSFRRRGFATRRHGWTGTVRCTTPRLRCPPRPTWAAASSRTRASIAPPISGT